MSELKRQTVPILSGIAVIAVIVLLESLFAVKLNHLYYTFFGPFYDSASYLPQLERTMTTARELGLGAGVQAAMQGTVFLPFFILAFLGLFLEPSRDIGIYLQAFWLFVLGITLFYYFFRFHTQSIPVAIAFTIPFLTPISLWLYNAGLSDFRMDLSLYIFSAISFTWFLASRYTHKRLPWILCGVFSGLTFLSRATAPAYFMVGMAPLLVSRFIFANAENRKRLLQNTGLMVLTALSLSLWFFIVKFKDLYYYYFIWNSDANAHLPFREALRHVEFVFRGMGLLPFCLIGLVLIIGLIFKIKAGSGDQIPAEKPPSDASPSPEVRVTPGNIDWEALWLGCAPLVLLVGKGMGLNSFVSMPAIFGLTLFIIKPLKPRSGFFTLLSKPQAAYTVLTLALAGLVFSATMVGIPKHMPVGSKQPEMRGLKQLRDTLITDSANRFQNEQVDFAIPYLGAASPEILWNVFLFDSPEYDVAEIKKRYQFSIGGQYPTRVDFETIAGKTDDERIQTLANTIAQSVDYVILPEEKAITFMEEHLAFNLCNLHIRKLKAKLLKSGLWVPVSPVIVIHDNEQVRVYRNQRLRLLKR